MNALKFLEEYCNDCVQITNLENNGDETINLTVRIDHPFPGHREYTGFDVKGIIMFTGSYEVTVPWWMQQPVPESSYVSWRETGDPEVLNPDGYTIRWNPEYDQGSPAPIFNYWEGKYASGTPTAHINAFKNFYTDEERHMFRDTGSIERTYHIYLPEGETVVAGYAVEACWEPPFNMPVTDPLTDFPITANQPEAYHFQYIINNDEPIQNGSDCCGDPGGSPFDCSTLRIELAYWDFDPMDWDDDVNISDLNGTQGGESAALRPCLEPYPSDYSRLIINGDWGGPGIYRIVGVIWVENLDPGPPGIWFSWDVTDRVVIE